MYAIMQQPSGILKGLIASKSRIAKKGLAIPRLELVAGHKAAKLVHNVREALQGFPITNIYCWTASTLFSTGSMREATTSSLSSIERGKCKTKITFSGAMWVKRKTLRMWVAKCSLCPYLVFPYLVVNMCLWQQGTPS